MKTAVYTVINRAAFEGAGNHRAQAGRVYAALQEQVQRSKSNATFTYADLRGWVPKRDFDSVEGVTDGKVREVIHHLIAFGIIISTLIDAKPKSDGPYPGR